MSVNRAIFAGYSNPMSRNFLEDGRKAQMLLQLSLPKVYFVL